jgi:hypothetical protein
LVQWGLRGPDCTVKMRDMTIGIIGGGAFCPECGARKDGSKVESCQCCGTMLVPEYKDEFTVPVEMLG